MGITKTFHGVFEFIKINAFILLYAFITFSLSVNAQDIVFGRIYDKESGMPLGKVLIETVDGTSYTKSRIDGSYELDVYDSELSSVRISSEGYRSVYKEYVQKGQLMDVYLERMHLDIYSIETKRIITQEQLEMSPSNDILKIVNKNPGILDGVYVRGGRADEMGVYFDGTNMNASEGRYELYPLNKYNLSSIVFSPSAFEEGFPDNISGSIKTNSINFCGGKGVTFRYEGNSILPKNVNYGYNRANLTYQGTINEGKTGYTFTFDANEKKTSNPLFLSRPGMLYENDSTGYAFECNLYDYFWKNDSMIDSTVLPYAWTEDSIPYFEARLETMINSASSDTIIVRKVYLDTIIVNKFTPEYFDSIGTHTPHTRSIQYSLFGKIESDILQKVHTEVSAYAYNSAYEAYSNVYMFHPEDFSSFTDKSWGVIAALGWEINNRSSMNISASYIYAKSMQAPQFNDTIFDDNSGLGIDTLIPGERGYLDKILNPLNQMDSITFEKIYDDYIYTGEYTDFPYAYYYPWRSTKWYNYFLQKKELKKEIKADWTGRFSNVNTVSTGAGLRENDISVFEEVYPDVSYWYSIYNASLLQSYAYIEDKVKTQNTTFKAVVKIDYSNPTIDTTGIDYIWYNYPLAAQYDVSYKFGINHNMNDFSGIRFSYETARQAGDFASLFTATGRDNMNNVVGNPNGKFEKSQTFDMGYTYEDGKGIYCDLSGYFKDYRDILYPITSKNIYFTNYPDYEFLNIGLINSKGVELKLGIDRGIFAVEMNYTYSVSKGSYILDYVYTPGFFNYWNFTYYKGSYRYVYGDGEGGEIQSRSSFYKTYDRRHKLDISHILRYPSNGNRIDNEDLVLYINHSIVSGRPASELIDNAYRSPFVYIADGKLSKNIKVGGLNLNVYISVENIFNTKAALRIHPVTLDPDSYYLSIVYDTMPDYLMGDSNYDVRIDLDNDGIITSEERHDFAFSAYIDYYKSAFYYTKPRNISIGVVLNF